MMNETINQDLQPWSAHRQQTVFRHVLRAFSFPGRVEILGAADGSALTEIVAALVDRESTLADPQHVLVALTLQRMQARQALPERAQFIVADGSEPPTFEPNLGTLESPEFGATILLQVANLGEGMPWQLSGPGIATTQRLQITGLHPAWLEHRDVWNEGFPLGVDLILIDAYGLVALPRTTVVNAATSTPDRGDALWAM